MRRIVWIASFPKSGNTWIRLLLSKYFDSSADLDINHLKIGRLANTRWLFDDWCALEGSDLTDREIDRYRSDVFRAVAAEATLPVFLKTHDQWRVNHVGEPIFPYDATLAVIYVIRNPLDVAVSFAAHINQTIGDAIGLMCDESLTIGDTPEGISTRFPQRVGSWSTHARSWVDQSGLPVVLVRYEDLHAAPLQTLTGLLEALGDTVDRQRVDQAVQACAFERLQRQERETGFVERYSQTELFFRGGRVGDGVRELAPEHRTAIIAAHAPMMSRFGYLSGSPQNA